MAIRHDRGVVLRSYPFGEADRVVVLLSPYRGKVRAVVKGIRKTTSRFGGRLESFAVVEVVVYEGRSLDTITQVETVEAFPRLRSDLGRVTAAAVMSEGIDAVAQEGEPSVALFDLLVEGLGALEAGPLSADLVPAFLLHLADVVGVGPSLDVCASCGRGDVVDRFSFAAGGAVCATCRPEGAGPSPRGRRRLPLRSHRRPPRGPAGDRRGPLGRSRRGGPAVRRAPPRPASRQPRGARLVTFDLTGLDPERIPRHVGLILDGNGRWANARGLARTAGHEAGEAALFDCIEGALEIGIEWLSAFTFSTENWHRAAAEVKFLMWFNRDLLSRRRDQLHELGIRIRFAGDLDDERIPRQNRQLIRDSEELTKENTAMTVVFAFNYGSRWEITNAARRLVREAAAGHITADDLDERVFARYLAVSDMPDLDLVIRSSGEHRLSNFLLWQAAYAELVFPGVLWPDFDRYALLAAVVEYQKRVRRFGGAVDLPSLP